MEVTKANFSSALEEIRSLLPKCFLVSFDTEFTGLRGSDVRENWDDTPDERYCKLRKGSSEFSLIQYGICLFTRHENKEIHKYGVFPFNFYLFPSHALDKGVPLRLDRCFQCQPSSLVLLSRSGLDFNKWIKEGVPYMREADEAWWRGKRKESEEPSNEELNKFLGFSQVFRMIADSNVPLVGHCIILDLLHSYSHFIGDIPEALMTFKSDLNKKLPSVYDTLLLCENDRIRQKLGPSLSLANVYKALSKPHFPQLITEFPQSCAGYGSGNHLHEAAYDAYLAGYVFLVISTMLRTEETSDLFLSVEPYKNRVYLHNCKSTDSLNLTGPEALASRDHIFHLTFPKEVTTEDIKNLFSPYGGCRVFWINDTSARISLNHRSRAGEAYKAVTCEDSAGGKLFIISRHTYSTTATATDGDVDTAVLGKRKERDKTEENALPICKETLFEENVQW